MTESLRERPVERRSDRVRFDGRVLFLVDDPELIRRQLAGENLEWPVEAPLRDNISTDEITPAYICYYYDETLGDFPYLGLKTGDEFPITRGTVRAGGFVCSVSGKRRGKGSSREQSPYAEMCAGIRLVLADSIERIYRENCQNLGILTSTNFSLVERVRQGGEIPLSVFTEGEGEITRGIIEHGGLFWYNVARLQGRVRVPLPSASERPMTLAEKIIARHWVTDIARDAVGVAYVGPGDEGFVRTDIRFSHEYVTPMAAIFWRDLVGEAEQIVDPGSVFFFRDHLTFLELAMTDERKAAGLLDVALELKKKQEEFAERQGVKLYGELPRVGPHTMVQGSEAICHSKILEQHALPGHLLVGSDSHTPHAGAIGCIAFGVGTTAIFNSWLTKDVRIKVPPSVLVRVDGRRPENVTAKDFMLQILHHPYVKNGHAIGKIVEYAGEAVEALSIDERATMTNMAAEVGAFTGIVRPDGKAREFLMRERGMDPDQIERLLSGLYSDDGADYETVIEIDAGALRPMVALPGDPGNGLFLEQLGGPVRVDIAYAGSCTAGKKSDMDMYARVFKEALDRGERVHPDVKCYIQCGSQEVKRYCEESGYLDVFRDVGAQFIEPSCGACINAGPGVSYDRETVTVSAINRNFPGRSGPGQLYLASPYTTAASAVAGYIAAWEPASEAVSADT
ncbi:MAG: 3-isopropylmalate dehydratase [Gemmatimonadales bacterium]|nr:3-isopropylmalate dehydratase [Gemmatimonadales bacterium]NIN10377.1 3-isopropylmalate dehydratase [Gemmatimonadales bacterium]NIN49169.1 3-isopropylmalate dehydratase [Gemmatimonadales bacterium]NIP06633.1 3-isopropylmalate dehydratase [Gemmatimonadales bacterium]NIQ99963.1 3-isopropylmalate dehydratase [Gemmatimonadales bacterium]